MSPGEYVKFLMVFFLSYFLLKYTAGIILASPTAQLVGYLVNCPVSGNAIVCGFNSYEIVPECTGIVSASLFIALLSVLPVSRRRLVRTIFFGILFLYLLNVLRVYVLILFSRSIFAFDLLHIIFWFATPLITVLYVRWLMK